MVMVRLQLTWQVIGQLETPFALLAMNSAKRSGIGALRMFRHLLHGQRPKKGTRLKRKQMQKKKKNEGKQKQRD